MADAILHIKDSYYFEVPKALWPAKYEKLDDLPPYLGFLKHEAEEQGRKFNAGSVKSGSTIYQIQGTGALILE